ncbi:hypothetical protein ACFL1N_14775 [Thermodesulfobacteriota bacterium]
MKKKCKYLFIGLLVIAIGFISISLTIAGINYSNDQLFAQIETYKVEYEKCVRGNNSACLRAVDSLQEIKKISQDLRVELQHMANRK